MSRVARKYRDKSTGVTGDRSAARANRKLQLIVSQSHPGERGYTLLEQMELLLQQTIEQRVELQHQYDLTDPNQDEEEDDKAWEAVVENAGEIKGMLKMLAIMRSTSSKIELQRARARIKHGTGPHSTER
jgi:hypothetical protein